MAKPATASRAPVDARCGSRGDVRLGLDPIDVAHRCRGACVRCLCTIRASGRAGETDRNLIGRTFLAGSSHPVFACPGWGETSESEPRASRRSLRLERRRAARPRSDRRGSSMPWRMRTVRVHDPCEWSRRRNRSELDWAHIPRGVVTSGVRLSGLGRNQRKRSARLSTIAAARETACGSASIRSTWLIDAVAHSYGACARSVRVVAPEKRIGT